MCAYIRYSVALQFICRRFLAANRVVILSAVAPNGDETSTDTFPSSSEIHNNGSHCLLHRSNALTPERECVCILLCICWLRVTLCWLTSLSRSRVCAQDTDSDVYDLLRGDIAVLEAAKRGNLSKIQRLITAENINCRDTQGRNSAPLHLAAGYNNVEASGGGRRCVWLVDVVRSDSSGFRRLFSRLQRLLVSPPLSLSVIVMQKQVEGPFGRSASGVCLWFCVGSTQTRSEASCLSLSRCVVHCGFHLHVLL